ncbi:MAG: helix-turn-helix transcriptional regulator [Methylococcaceae bacterium]
MNTLTNYQTILGNNGKPTFVVIPYDDFFQPRPTIKEGYVPHEVVSLVVGGSTMLQAWREYLRHTQTEIAQQMGITLVEYTKLETMKRPSKKMRQKATEALGISLEQLVY